MKLAFCLFKYFAYGGLQRDFLDIVQLRVKAGDEVVVYVRQWQANCPANFKVCEINTQALTNHARYACFYEQVKTQLQANPVDCVIGFNKMPGLDIYFAADPCRKSHWCWWQSMLARYRHLLSYEQAVFGQDTQTRILVLTQQQKMQYQQAWHTPEERFNLLPPGIDRRTCADHHAKQYRQAIRQDFAVSKQQIVLLMIGSGFRTKGLDRALIAISSLPDDLRARVRLLVFGQDNPKPFKRLINKMGLSKQASIHAGRDDIPAIMQAGDLLLHPARREITGKVILEAIVAGLPVLATDVCGYAHHVEKADAGLVLTSPFSQLILNELLLKILHSTRYLQWRKNGIAYGQTHNLYGMAEAVSAIIDTYDQTHKR